MEKDFSPKGWLGLILGTRMWYAFWEADQDDDAAFETRLDRVVREIGAKNASFAPFCTKNDHFAKTGSGQT